MQMNHHMDSKDQLALKSLIAEKLAPFSLSHTTIELEFPEESCRDNIEDNQDAALT